MPYVFSYYKLLIKKGAYYININKNLIKIKHDN